MKRCPDCRRDYYDDTLLFCLDDGRALLDGPATLGGQETVLLPSFRSPAQATTAIFAPIEGVTSAPGNSIGVLPFVNMSADIENEYMCDGLAEELLNGLAKIRDLRVAARTSAFSFKGKQTTTAEIGRILNVASLLEGSIRMAGKRIRISVQLIKVADGYHLWSETYDRFLDDIFAVQDDIARSVVEELRARLLGKNPSEAVTAQIVSEVAEAFRGRPDDPEAQRLALLGRYFLDRSTREDTAKAIGYFTEALEIDPEYALGWAELGRAYSVQAGRAWVPESEGFERSREAAAKALTLDPDLAEGHAQLGRIQATHDLDLISAESSYKRALNTSESSAVLDGAAVMEYKLGRFAQAIELLSRAIVQDPLSTSIWHNLGLACHAAGRLADSERAFRRALEIAPRRVVSNALLATVLMDEGRMDEAFEQTEKEPDEFWRLWALAVVNNAAGNRTEADTFLDTLTTEHASGNAYQLAQIYSARGEKDLAFSWLERALDERDPGVTHTKADPRFVPLYEDPRWKKFLRKVGF